MSNPTKMPLTPITAASPFFELPFSNVAHLVGPMKAKSKEWRDPKKVRDAFKKWGARNARSLVHDPQLTTSKQALKQLAAGSKPMVVAQVAPPTFSMRLACRVRVYRAVRETLPLEAADRLDQISTSLVRCGGGVNMAYGRLKKVFEREVGELHPFTEEEVRRAVRQCGLSLEGKKKIALKELSGDGGIKINTHARLGAPFFFKPKDDPDRVQLVLEYANGLAQTLQQHYDRDHERGVRDALTIMSGGAGDKTDGNEQAHFFTAELAVKTDFYSVEKVEAEMMRAYFIPPALGKVLSQQLLQSAEEHWATALTNTHVYTVQRTGFAHGNVNILLRNANAQLQRCWAEDPAVPQVARAHGGDDGFFVVRDGDTFHHFSTDCSNFDFTQEFAIKEPCIREFCKELSRIDPMRAQLVYELHCSLPTVVGNAVAMRLKRGGRSGLNGQGELNDIQHDAEMNRVVDAIRKIPLGEVTKDKLESIVNEQARRVGFVAKFADYFTSNASSLTEHVAECPLLFMGYYITARKFGQDTQLTPYPMMDPERALPRMVYSHQNTGKFSDAEELLSLAGTAINLGVPAPGTNWLQRDYSRAFRTYQKEVLKMLQKAEKDNVPFPSAEVVHKQGEFVYSGIDNPFESWASLARSIRGYEKLWLRPLETADPFRLVSDGADGSGEDTRVAIPCLLSLASDQVLGDDWAMATELDEDAQTAPMVSKVGVPLKGKVSFAIKPVCFQRVTDEHVGHMPPLKPKRLDQGQPSGSSVSAGKKKKKPQKASFVLPDPDEDPYEDYEVDDDEQDSKSQASDVDGLEDLDRHRSRIREFLDDQGDEYADDDERSNPDVEDGWDQDAIDRDPDAYRDFIINQHYANVRAGGQGTVPGRIG